MVAPGGERLAKRLARAGLCSRREAERWIEAGRVALDGQTVTSPAVNVDANTDIRVDGEALPQPEPARLWRYHKPRGLVTTTRDERGRPTVFSRLPADLPRVMTVGRLDMDSEGLLILTNDGGWARHLELPATGWLRRYRVRVHGRVQPKDLQTLAGGVTIDGVRYGTVEAKLDRQTGANAWLTVTLREGKNREVRRLMEHLGYRANRLIRTAFGPIELGDLPAGTVAEIPRRRLRNELPRELLQDQVNAGRRR